MKLLKEPLLHFLVLGALIFLLAPPDTRRAAPVRVESDIMIPAATIDRLADDFEALQARAPSDAELRELVDREILAEAYAREGFRRGLERDDPIVQRRLREKMKLLAEESVRLPTPDDDTLRAFLAEHAESFRSEPRLSLRQVFFDPEQLGPEPQAALAPLLGQLRAGDEIEGHETLLPSFRPDAPLRSLAATFGSTFADQLTSLPVGEWSGPLQSGFGFHLVQVEDRKAGEVPSLEQALEEVRAAWEQAETERQLSAFNRKLMEQYDVSIEWPENREESP